MQFLKRWFGRSGTEVSDRRDRVPLHVAAAAMTDAGCVRAENQDSVYLELPSEGALSLLATVADGMGGHAGGRTASRVAVEAVAAVIRESPGAADPLALLGAAAARANDEVYQRAQEDPTLRGMGTTLTVLLLHNSGDGFALHVGDSRLYRIREGASEQLSRDHTLVEDLRRNGVITAEQAAVHPDRNLVTQAIGTKPSTAFDAWALPDPMPGDTYVLCSDGLHDLVTEAEMAELAAGGDPAPACRRLVELARARGAPDNISAIVAHVEQRLASSDEPVATRPPDGAVTGMCGGATDPNHPDFTPPQL